MKKSNKGTVIQVASMALAVSLAMPVKAQSVLEEVIVTARKRSENLQDVAAAISAISGDALKDMGAYDFRELGAALANVTVSNDQNSVDISIRGVSNNRGFAAATAFHIDGIYAGNGASGLAAFLDVNRVEVIRGPAGTLYGRNATAGAVNVISNRPDIEKRSLSAEVSAGNDGYNNVQLVGNYGVSDKLAVRLAFMTEDRDGWSEHESYDADIPDQETDDADLSAYRLKVLWEPTESVSWLLGYEYFERGSSGRRLLLDWDKSIARGSIEEGFEENLNANQQRKVKNDPRYVPANDLYGYDLEQDFLMSELNIDLGWGQVTYLAGYRDLDEDGVSDSDFYGGNFDTITKYSYEEQSHELRLSGETESLKWLVGLYYWDSETDSFFQQDFSSIIPDTINIFDGKGAESESLGIFSQATWSISDAWRVTAGLRYTEDEGDNGSGISGLLREDINLIPREFDPQEGDWDDVSWKLGLEYDIAESSMLYANVATGFKTGGLNSPTLDTTFDEETVTSYEVGSKNQFWDGRLQLNGALFYYDYEDLQISGIEVVDEQPVLAQTNLPEAEMFGGELEWIALVGDSVRLNGAIAYLDTEATEGLVDDPTSAESGDLIDVSGNSLRKAPEWSFSLGAQNEWDLAANGSLTARVDFSWVDEQYHDVVNVDQNLEDDYTKTDLTVTWRAADADFFVQAYWRHIEDEDVRTTIYQTPIGALSSFMAPESYGLRMGYTFE
jgi:iron complex outermembrane receptor protein